MLGPFDEPLLPTLRISPLGIVPKKAAGKYRLIHHLSYLHGESVNDGIPGELCSVCHHLIRQSEWCVPVGWGRDR